MAMKFIETDRENSFYIDVVPGQVIYCEDTDETYLDTDEKSRIPIPNVVYLEKETDRDELPITLRNRAYVVKESGIIYRYEGVWYKILDPRTLICTVYKTDEYIPATLVKNDKKFAPRSLASCVYNDAGVAIGGEIEESNKLTLSKTKYVYVEATTEGQKVFKIPYPISDYDFRTNFMTVIIKNEVCVETRFTIRDDDYFVLNDEEEGLKLGELVIFLFYYNVYIDINDGVLISTKNLRDRSVTEPKLDNDAVSTRTIIPKNVTNQKLADASVDGRVLAPNSVSTKHINTADFNISSNNVTDNAQKRFVTDELINKWNKTTETVNTSPKIHVSASEPRDGIKDTDIWVDITNFVFKVRVSGQWKAMGAVYN